MLGPRIVQCIWGTALAAVLTGSAAGQTADLSKRIVEAQELRSQDRFIEARAVYQALLRDIRKDSASHHLEALVFDCLGVDEQDRRDFGAAETAYNQGLASVQTKTPDDPALIALPTHLAELYIAEIRPDDGCGMAAPAGPIARRSACTTESAHPTSLGDLQRAGRRACDASVAAARSSALSAPRPWEGRTPDAQKNVPYVMKSRSTVDELS